MKISAVLITLNEERNIRRCLESVAQVADEIIVADSRSTDNTAAICRDFEKVRFFSVDWAGYSATKNWANNQATGDYILSVDADEELSETLIKSILRLKRSSRNSENTAEATNSAYSFNRRTCYCGTWINYCGWYPDTKIRMFPAGRAEWLGEHVHETLELSRDVKVYRLRGDLNHYSYHSVEDHKNRIEKYSDLHARKLHQEGKAGRLLNLIFNPVGKFLNVYLFNRGFMDRKAGLIISLLSAHAVYLKYRKLRKLSGNGWRRASQSPRIVSASPERPLHIMISRTDAIGDVILTLPMAGMLRKHYPDAIISFMACSYTEPVLRCCRNIDRIYCKDLIFSGDDRLFGCSDDHNTAVMKRTGADVIIHVYPDEDILRLAARANIGLRIGNMRKFSVWRYCNYRLNFSRYRSGLHESQLNLKMLKPLGITRIPSSGKISSLYGFKPPETDAGHVEHPIFSLISRKRVNLVIHPGSRGSAVRWDFRHFMELIKLLPAQRFNIFISGTEKERAGIDREFDIGSLNSNVHIIAGELSLEQFIRLVARCDALLACSTGPLHIAAMAGILAVGLYSLKPPIHPGRWGPVGSNTHVFDIDTVTPAEISSFLFRNISEFS